MITKFFNGLQVITTDGYSGYGWGMLNIVQQGLQSEIIQKFVKWSISAKSLLNPIDNTATEKFAEIAEKEDLLSPGILPRLKLTDIPYDGSKERFVQELSVKFAELKGILEARLDLVKDTAKEEGSKGTEGSYKISPELEELDGEIALAERFRDILKELSLGNLNAEDKEFVIENANTLSRNMTKYGHGLVDTQPPWSSYIVRNHPIFTDLPRFLDEPIVIVGSGSHEAWINELRSILIGYLDALRLIRTRLIQNEKGNNKQQETDGSLKNLEESLVSAIYEQIIKNPSLYHKEYRSLTEVKRKYIKKRDKYVCQICQKMLPEKELQVDHIFPWALGGSHLDPNLMAICETCNGDKGKQLAYYQGEGREKLKENIRDFVRNIPMILNFGDWIETVVKEKRDNNALHPNSKKRKSNTQPKKDLSLSK